MDANQTKEKLRDIRKALKLAEELDRLHKKHPYEVSTLVRLCDAMGWKYAQDLVFYVTHKVYPKSNA